MTRKYPVLEEQLSLDEMLALPPLPRTFRYVMQKEETERKLEVEENHELKEELEAAKKRLRELACGIK